jgi:hypothetical protein
MEERETIRVLETNLERLLGWISAADARFNTVLAIDTALLGVIAAITPPYAGWTIPSAIFSTIAALLLGASVLFLAFAMYPRTSGPRGSLVYFGGIAALEADEYLRRVRGSETNNYLEDLAVQCHRNAEIADKKFRWIKRAMTALLLSLLPWALAVYLLYAVRV